MYECIDCQRVIMGDYFMTNNQLSDGRVVWNTNRRAYDRSRWEDDVEEGG